MSPRRSVERHAYARFALLAAAMLSTLLQAGDARVFASDAVPGFAADPGAGAPLTAADRPAALRDVGFDQRLGASVPLDLRLRDETGKEVGLGDLFHERPVVLMLGYYGCPMLCPLVMDGLVRSLKPLSFTPGRELEVVTVSIDPTENAAQAEARKHKSLERYGRPESADGWHFLTGSQASIDALASAIGFRYSHDPNTGQYAHAAGIVILTPRGQIARYLFGAEISPRDLRLGLVEAAEGKVGNVIDQVLLFCFHYDPIAGSYSATALRSVRIGGLVTVLLLAGLIGFALWRERSRPGGSSRAWRSGGSA